MSLTSYQAAPPRSQSQADKIVDEGMKARKLAAEIEKVCDPFE
jgi:hypothetical protein